MTKKQNDTAPELSRALLNMLVCPVSRGTLRYDKKTQELISEKAKLAFPIREGIPIMLESEARALED